MRRNGSFVRGRTVTLEYLTSTTNKAGVTYYYLRLKGNRIPLGKGPIDTPDFLAAYGKALSEAREAKPSIRAAHGTVASLCEVFKSGTLYQTYSSSYRSTLDRHMSLITESYGPAKIATLKPKHIRVDLSKLKPHAANNRLKTWRLLCELAYEHGLSPICATDGVKRGRLPKSDGHKPWTKEDIAAYRKRWPIGTVQRLSMELLYWTAARTIDAVTLSPSMIGPDGVLTFTQAKTGGKANVPWDCDLPDWAPLSFDADRAHLKSCLTSGVFTYLETSSGRVRSRKGLSNVVSAAAKAAKRTDISAHGLRKARLTAIAEAGGSSSVIMSWGGHESLKEAEEYTSTANRKSLVIGNGTKTESDNTSIQSDNKRAK